MSSEEILVCLKIALNQAVEEFAEIIASNVHASIYQQPASRYYVRSGNFYDAVSHPVIHMNSRGSGSIEWYDKSRIKSRNGVAKKSRFGNYYMLTFGQHRSWPWDEPNPSDAEVKENLYDWLNEGFTILGKKIHRGYYFDIDTDFKPGTELYERFLEIATGEILARRRMK